MARFVKLVLSAGEHDRALTPVTALVPGPVPAVPAFQLRDEKTHRCCACQVEAAQEGFSLTWLSAGLKAGQTQRLVLESGRPQPPRVRIEDQPVRGRADVHILGKHFTSYVYGKEWVRPYLFPVIGPGGVQVTRQYPLKHVRGEHQDHPHHKSIWVAHGDCNGVDNWSEEPKHGWQRHQRFERLDSGPVFGRIRAVNFWCHSDGRKQFEETREIRFYALPGGVRLFDLDLVFHMSQGPVTFGDTKEGGLVSVRVASSMDVRNGGRIENAFGGVQERETWGQAAAWCDYSGMAGGRRVGIAILEHKSNPRFPTGWHVRDYGLMTANCFASSYYHPEAKLRGDMAFKKGQRPAWRYRLYIHKGDARQGRVSNRFLDYFAPPSVSVR